MDTPPDNRRNELTVVPYSSTGWNVVLYLVSSFPITDHVARQNSVGNVVLFNRRNNQIQLSTNAHSLENGVDETASSSTMCPTCHRPLHEDSAHSQSPAFMDSEYFRMLSSVGSDAGSDTREFPPTDRVSDGPNVPEERPRGSLPRSAFNQGYFEQYPPPRPCRLR
jgi:hypothetical protein